MILTFSVGAFLVVFLIHIGIWRIKKPLRQTRVLLFIFFGFLFAEIVFLGIKDHFNGPVLIELLHISVIYTSMALGYIVFYSAMEVDSPSLRMVMAIHDEGSQGLERGLLDNLMTEDVLVKPRLMDLIRDEMVVFSDSKYKIAPKGRSLIKILNLYYGLIERK